MDDKRLILVIDDELQIRNTLRGALGDAYRLIEGDSATNALRMVVSAKPDLILLDSSLPDGDTPDIIAALREWTDAPLIVMAAGGGDEEAIKALAAGASDYAAKPFNIDVIRARVRANLRRYLPLHASVRQAA